MFDKNFLDDLSKRFSDAMPSGVKDLKTDMEGHFRNAMQYTFSKMDLITREEFDIQTKVLERTRETVDALLIRVAALEMQVFGESREPKAENPSPDKSADDIQDS